MNDFLCLSDVGYRLFITFKTKNAKGQPDKLKRYLNKYPLSEKLAGLKFSFCMSLDFTINFDNCCSL